MRFHLPALILGLALPLAAADFGFSVVIRAGDSLTSSGNYEIGIGAVGLTPSSTRSLTTNFMSSPGPRNFEVGYRNVTNTAYLRVYNAAGTSFQEVTYSPAGGGVPEPTRRWSLPGSAFRTVARATQYIGFPAPGGVTADNLSLTGAMSVIQPLSVTSLSATQDGVTGGVASMGPNVVFMDSGTGPAGNWSITGRILFSGSAVVLGGPDRLSFGLTARAGEVPESGTFLLVGIALVGAFLYRAKPKPQSESK